MSEINKYPNPKKGLPHDNSPVCALAERNHLRNLLVYGVKEKEYLVFDPSRNQIMPMSGIQKTKLLGLPNFMITGGIDEPSFASLHTGGYKSLLDQHWGINNVPEDADAVLLRGVRKDLKFDPFGLKLTIQKVRDTDGLTPNEKAIEVFDTHKELVFWDLVLLLLEVHRSKSTG